jgi:hypothetical protein
LATTAASLIVLANKLSGTTMFGSRKNPTPAAVSFNTSALKSDAINLSTTGCTPPE